MIAGSRLNGSDGYDNAVRILSDSLKKYGFSNIHTETFNTNFKNWNLKDFKANIITPEFFPLIAQPKAYTCGTNGTLKSELVFLGTNKMGKIHEFSGKLKGKTVLMDHLLPSEIIYEPLVTRLHDTTLQRISSKIIPTSKEVEKRKEEQKQFYERLKKYFSHQSEIIEFLENEGVAAIIGGGQSPYGMMQVMNAMTSKKPIDPFDAFAFASIFENTVKIPQLVVAEDYYHSLASALNNGQKIELELLIHVEEKEPRLGYSLFAEIPGNDLKNEIVLIGAHLDAHTAGTGAADNMVGIVTCIEALRILQKSGYMPKRTIRVALWGGEEMGLLGSAEYAKSHFIKNSKEKLYAYFNTDYGAGAFRGIFAQESNTAYNIFKEWVKYIDELKFQTISPDYTGDSDHISFSDNGLPGFQFMPDPLDYMKVFHSNLDIVERIPPEDVRFNAMIMAIMVWLSSETETYFKN